MLLLELTPTPDCGEPCWLQQRHHRHHMSRIICAFRIPDRSGRAEGGVFELSKMPSVQRSSRFK